MADSLFDNRYRYDYIYPRGRSGESLRALDTQGEDRRVVIKRPAPNDAPPIRAGQEVSIINERQALRRLAGHPVLTELLGDGQFFVGGMAHQYIVMERAEGLIVADLVLELAGQGERIPLLETLVIIDHLLDLLHSAHSKDIVYNDVDAKHLFWNREQYRLKAIDWGNAVFLEGDEITQQGISRQTDIYQVGELLYFIVTGGRRADVPRDAGMDFKLDFGEDGRRVHSRLQEIISRAMHPNSRLRYPSIQSLRSDLAKFREPLERERNATISTVLDKLRRGGLSKNELRTLRAMVDPAMKQDPGYPQAKQVFQEIGERLRDLEVESDLDAVHIYLQSANWSRAAQLLDELRTRTGSQTTAMVALLYDIAQILNSSKIQPVSEATQEAINLIYDGFAPAAATALMLDPAEGDENRALSWLLAERLSAHVPEVLLLRPNLYRLQLSLDQLAHEGLASEEAQNILIEVDRTLERGAIGPLDMPGLRDSFREVVEQLTAVNRILQTFAVQHQLSNKQLPLSSLDRALNAAMSLADSMHVIGKQATSSPRDAMQSLDSSRAIDPTNPIWDEVEKLLNMLYERLQSCQTYVPVADGSDLQAWLVDTQADLKPFMERLFDELLTSMVRGLNTAENSWQQYRAAVIQGDRDSAETVLTTAAQSVSTISPTLAAWFSQLRSVIHSSHYTERHSVPGGLGRALADGWEAFDRARLSDAERLGQQALEIARTENDVFAAQRLLDISRLTREWVERGAVSSTTRTQAVMAAIDQLFTADEKATLDSFTAQMPSTETYLKAMSRGLVGVYGRRSTAALRLLFVHYLLLGTLDGHEGQMVDAEFWRDAAARCLGDVGERHVAMRTLDEFLERRRDLEQASALFEQVSGKHILPELDKIRRKLEDSEQSRLLAPGIQSLRDIESATREWADGEFRAAGTRLETALRGVNEVEQAGGFKLSGLRAWLMDLMQAAADLHVLQRELRQMIDQRPDHVDGRISNAFQRMADLTQQMLSQEISATLRQWNDTYLGFVNAFNADERRSKRLERFNELFRAMFIDRHPAYALFRHWYGVLENAPEFPAPPTSDPTPRIADEVSEDLFRESPYSESVPLPDALNESAVVAPARGRRGGRSFIFAGILLLIFIISAAAVLLSNQDSAPRIEVTISATPQDSEPGGMAIAEASAEADASLATTEAPSSTPSETPITPSLIPTEEAANLLQTEESPSPDVPSPTMTDTPEPTATEPPSATPTITPTPSETPRPSPTPLPAQGVQGNQSLLDLFSRLEVLPFNPEVFTPTETGWRMGNSGATPGDVLYISPPPDVLEAFYGNNAASRIRSIEAEITLRTYNPAIVSGDDIYFGLLLQSLNDGNNAGVRLQVVDSTVINLAQVRNNTNNFVSQRSVNAVVALLRLDRDPQTGAVTVFYNDAPLGQPIEFINADAPVIPVLYVKDGGVILGVLNWRVSLR